MSGIHFLKEMFVEAAIQPLSGGDINEVYCVTTKEGDFVVKLNKKDEFPLMFQREKKGLELLSSKGEIRIPRTIDLVENENYQALVIEFIATGTAKQDFWESFGESLAKQHLVQNNQFGLDHSNYIGSLTQKNQFCDSWEEFLITMRLNPMLELAIDSGLIDYGKSVLFENFYNRINEIYPNEKPALLHGDLWSGNYLIDQNGSAVLIDPAVYYGHREMEIGMMHLFGGFDSRLFRAYNSTHALEKDWESRIEINQLYPLMVHLNLFGKSYWNKVERILRPF